MACARKHGRYGHRNATMILVAYRHGLRASELCELQWHQIELSEGRLHVRRVRNGSHNLPAVYFQRFFVNVGGLISYGPDYLDQYRRAAGYVDRILRGEKPADLPVPSGAGIPRWHCRWEVDPRLTSPAVRI
jgi:hypothetical protein